MNRSRVHRVILEFYFYSKITKMENMFLISTIIAICYLLLKFIEMRFIEKENKPIKLLVRDTIIVYFSALLAFFVFHQTNDSGAVAYLMGESSQAAVFTNSPDF